MITSKSDELARLTGVSSPAGTFTYAHWGPGLDPVTRLTLPSGAYSDRTFDGLNRLTNISLTGTSGVLDQYGYSYNEGSQRTQQVCTAENYINYTYDNLGQLKTANGFDHVRDPSTWSGRD